eukprot:scaffold43352_cov70-Phaeocystis_antarctica.AAC.5
MCSTQEAGTRTVRRPREARVSLEQDGMVEEDGRVADHLRQEDDEVGEAVRRLQQDRVGRGRRRRFQQEPPVVTAAVPCDHRVQAHRDRDHVVQEARRVPHPRGHVGSRAALGCAQHETAEQAQHELDEHIRRDDDEGDEVLAQEPLERVVREWLGQVNAGVAFAVHLCTTRRSASRGAVSPETREVGRHTADTSCPPA